MIAFMGGNHAGVIGLLMSKAYDDVLACVAYTEDVKELSLALRIPTYTTIKDPAFVNALNGADILLSVHGREIVPLSILNTRPCINVHPCFFRFKGGDPIGRLLKTEPPYLVDVTAHRMTEIVDTGDVVYSSEKIIDAVSSVQEIYNHLYPMYVETIMNTLKIQLRGENK